MSKSSSVIGNEGGSVIANEGGTWKREWLWYNKMSGYKLPQTFTAYGLPAP